MAKPDRRKIPVVVFHKLDGRIIDSEIVSRLLKFKNNKEYVNFAGRDREVTRKLGIATIEYKSVTIHVNNTSHGEQCWWCNQIIDNK